MYPLPSLGAALVRLAIAAVVVLLVPWSAIIVLTIGFWWTVLVSLMILYPRLERAFNIEESTREAYPGQIPEYETDEEWIERRKREEQEEHAKAIRDTPFYGDYLVVSTESSEEQIAYRDILRVQPTDSLLILHCPEGRAVLLDRNTFEGHTEAQVLDRIDQFR